MILNLPRSCRALGGVSLAFALLCAGSSRLAAQSPEPEAIAWQDHYGPALDLARETNRLLWIQFTGPWCPNCTRMELESLPHPPIVEHARRSFVPVKLQADANDQLVLAFGLTGLPASVIVAPNRDVVAIRQGFLGPAELDAFLTDCLDRCPVTMSAVQPETMAVVALSGPAIVCGGNGRATIKTNAEPRNKRPLALGGFCPVSLVRDRRLVAGKPELATTHEGRIYRFANSLMSEQFRKEPQVFIPANDGRCPVSEVESGRQRPGDPRFGVLYQGHLFLCASAEDRRRFLEDPASFERVDVAEDGFCAHCIRESGLLVPGDPRHELARGGRRFWFPDSGHQRAFLTMVR
jgi:YHS domain-containing protein